MISITKRIKISFLAIALVFGIGAAFAQEFQAEPESINPESQKFDCQSSLTPTCRTATGGIMYEADSDNLVPSEDPAYDLQHQD